VEAYEDVTVPAGTFKAYKIARKWSSKRRHGQADAWSNVAWFAPEVKQVVKYVTTGRFDDPFELVSYSLK
jgi:hypothetical protein